MSSLAPEDNLQLPNNWSPSSQYWIPQRIYNNQLRILPDPPPPPNPNPINPHTCSQTCTPTTPTTPTPPTPTDKKKTYIYIAGALIIAFCIFSKK